jgi:tetratricopeptide (TPR) repeat protein
MDEANRVTIPDKSRVEFLRETLRTDPGNTFIRYGLALELAQYGDPNEAWQHFEYLLTRHPEYSATYYQAGMFLLNLGRREEAQKTFAKGIEVTGQQGNLHAQSELQAALEKAAHEKSES